jgi:hypothetical protein
MFYIPTTSITKTLTFYLGPMVSLFPFQFSGPGFGTLHVHPHGEITIWVSAQQFHGLPEPFIRNVQVKLRGPDALVAKARRDGFDLSSIP